MSDETEKLIGVISQLGSVHNCMSINFLVNADDDDNHQNLNHSDFFQSVVEELRDSSIVGIYSSDSSTVELAMPV